MGLFKPSWKSSDPLKRCDAIKTLKDEEKLKKIAAQDPVGYVRYAALERITDEKFLAAYALQIGDAGLRKHALLQIHSVPVLAQLAVLLTEDHSSCSACFENLPSSIPRAALDVLYPAGGWAALLAAERMKDVPMLEKLRNDPEHLVRSRAESNLQHLKKERQMKTGNPEELRRLLLESEDEEVVLNAAAKLRDDELVYRRLAAEAANETKNKNRRNPLAEKLAEKLSDPGVLKRLFDLDSDVFRLSVCTPAFRKLAKSDPDFVREAAQSDKYGSSVRARAVAELDDPDLLAEIGLQNPDLRYEVMRNKHFNRDQRLLAAVLNDPGAGRSLVEDAAKHIADRSLIQKRLFTEKDPEILRILCSNVPELQPYADDVKKVLGSRPEASVSYGQRQMTEKVIETFGRDAAVKLAGWTDAARHLIAFAETRPPALLPLWDRLDAAITGSETEIRYRRTLNTGKSEWDSAAQDFKFFYDEETWTKKEPTGLVFPPRDP